MTNNKYESGTKLFESKARKILGNQQKTAGLIKNAMKKATNKKGALTDIWDKLHLMLDLVRAWTKGEYREISNGTILTVIAAILYFVSPLDFVPDFIMGLGIIDDAAVIGFTVKQITKELESFQAWRNREI